MKVESQIHLQRAFVPRHYQMNFINAVEKDKKKRALIIWPRRAGKDIVAFNLAVRAALRSPQVIYYIFPTYSQGRKVLFDSITNDGKRFTDFIPDEFINSINHSELKIKFINGSLLQVVGSDNYDALMGTNPKMCIFSEYALQDPRAYQYIRPILIANEGTVIFISTPRGKNHLWELYNIAKNHPDYFCEKLTVNDTGHISLFEIQKEIQNQEISEDLSNQEYFTSFEMGIEGSYYIKYIDKMRLDGRIGIVPWESAYQVHTTWDLGVRDATTIIFFQIVGQTIRIIDCYSKSKEGLEFYANIIKSKPYNYGRHIAPFDIKVQEFGSGITRIEKARQLGIKFTIANEVGLMDGIEATRSAFSKFWIDEKNCAPLIKAMENYRQEYDNKKNIYKPYPLHDSNSHYCDALRYLCVSLPKTRDGLSAEDLDRRYREAMYGDQAALPPAFRDPLQSF